MPNDQAKIAHILESCLESIQKGEETIDSVLEKYPNLADRLRPQLETALWIGNQSHAFDPTPEFISSSRHRLVRRIKYESTSAAAKPHVTFWDWLIHLPQKRLAFRFALTMLLVLSLVFSTNRLALAASYTIPGDMLHPVKITHENVRVLFTFTPEGDLALHTDFARQRLIEIEALVLEGRYNFIPATVEGYQKQISLAMTALHKVVERQTQRVEELASQLYQVMAVESQVLGGIYELAPNEVRGDLVRVREISQAGIKEMQAMPLAIAFITPSPPTATFTQPVISETTETLQPTTTNEQPTEEIERPEISPSPEDTLLPGVTPLTSPTSPALQPTSTAPPSDPTQPPPPPTPVVTNTPLPPTPLPTNTQVPEISGSINIRGVFVDVNVSNNLGTDVTITRIFIDWLKLRENQKLQSVITTGFIWNEGDDHPPTDINSLIGSDTLRLIPNGTNQNITFGFFNSVDTDDFKVTITIYFNTGHSVTVSK